MDDPVKPPPPLPVYGPGISKWSTGLCGCFSDISNCCCTLWCPCITFGRNAEILDKGMSSCAASGTVYCALSLFAGLGAIYTSRYRAKLRYEYMLPPRPCDDCLVHYFCKLCALCQEYRELKCRGLDPALGWYGNLRKHAQTVVMPPTVPEEMKR
ncbi:cell number regulator 9-like [Cynara cardunculus var. scolymus]|uniref:cell number regulator 9-like n=1 Tax=Cynara cardunculus var. scolymus TaxID=59895 RepID=UPI000D62D81C|nr:cell number regulator 9-like [Cynara cardunculus var. scolymus]